MMLNATSRIGRYEIIAEIGRGAMGIVYKAHDPKIDRIVAVKTILLFDLEPPDEQEYRERFYEEARTAGRLSHPGIVTVFDVEPNPGNANLYIVMEYVDGKSLNKLLAENDGRLPLGPALRLAQEIAEALYFAHSQGVVHRDIKPENILVTPEGHTKIADFGIARLDHGHLTVPGRMLGSPAYMSPEQLNGKNTDGRSDLFSLGVVLYTMLTGHRPFQGNSTATICFKLANRDPLPVSAWNLDFPSELDELVGRAMAKDPAQRFQTGMEMSGELQRFREAHESQPQPLAGIMRIIGQEPVAIPTTDNAEKEPDPDSLHAIISNALSSQRDEPAPVAPIAKEISSNRLAFVAPRISLLRVAGMGSAALLVITGFAVWSKQKHSKGNELVSSATATKVTGPVHEITPVQSNTADDSMEDHKVKPKHSSNPGAPQVANRARLDPPSVQRDLSIAAVPVIHQDVNSSRTPDPPLSPESVTVNMVHLSDLNVTIEHSFHEAQASISVDKRMVYTEELHGEKKRRALVFSRTQGLQSGSITLVPGKHDIVVRVRSANDGYDASQSLTQGFSPGSKSTLLVKCDKRKKRLELSMR
jgi:eukaryotic-like serine/threonine-protein kinase